jgi:hypothetical protein
MTDNELFLTGCTPDTMNLLTSIFRLTFSFSFSSAPQNILNQKRPACLCILGEWLHLLKICIGRVAASEVLMVCSQYQLSSEEKVPEKMEPYFVNFMIIRPMLMGTGHTLFYRMCHKLHQSQWYVTSYS